VNLGMHVHGPWSEGDASWALHMFLAQQCGVDVVYMTDHNFRARATGYMTGLSGAFVASTTGAHSSHAATLASGAMRLMIKSSTKTPASQVMSIEPNVNAWDHLRTGIGGQVLTITYGSVAIPSKGMHEVVVTLSIHPAFGGRPQGRYSLRYRFMPGTTRKSYSTSGGGLVGIINMPSLSSGNTVAIKPEADIVALWPDMQPKDNGFYLLAFSVTTAPAANSTVDVHISGVKFARPENDAASVIANQRSIIAAYVARFPNVKAILSEEISLGPLLYPHCNVFGAPPKFDSMAGLTPDNFRDYYAAYIEAAQAMTAQQTQGFTTWNHPYGFSAGGVTDPQPTTTRRNLFTTQFNDPVAPFLGALGLEVGYAWRGGVSTQEHLNLWHTFTRNGVFLTGSGANDAHNSGAWKGLGNGFITGVFPTQLSDQAIAAGLRAGNAFTVHPGKWSGAMLSSQVSGVPMGGVTVSAPATRRAEISVANLPAGCRLQLLASPVDYVGPDPCLAVVGEWTSTQVGTGGSGTVTTDVTQTSSAFFCAQVVNSSGTPIATGNPSVFLTAEPPRGIPADRRVN
jgi:hypothetical protein